MHEARGWDFIFKKNDQDDRDIARRVNAGKSITGDLNAEFASQKLSKEAMIKK